MQKLKINENGFTVYELTKIECEKMLAAVGPMVENTYPNRGKGYAAVVMTSKGNLYAGASYESDTQSLTMHGEAVAFTHANLHNERDIVAITGPNCHICKQLIWESSLRSKIDIVIVIKEEGKIKQIPISDLMPYPWPEK